MVSIKGVGSRRLGHRNTIAIEDIKQLWAQLQQLVIEHGYEKGKGSGISKSYQLHMANSFGDRTKRGELI